MHELQFMSVTKAFNMIGATKADGSTYLAVRGISVSNQGRHFAFWEIDVVSHDDQTMELYREPDPESRW